MRKEYIMTVIGVSGSFVSNMFGGWSSGIATLLIMMALDYITGFMVAAIFKKSTKTENGALNSSVGLKGLCKKIVMLIMVIMAHRFDVTIGTSYIRDAVVIALMVNEAISILENAGQMGMKIPKVMVNAIDILKEKAGEEKSDDEEKEC